MKRIVEVCWSDVYETKISLNIDSLQKSETQHSLIPKWLNRSIVSVSQNNLTIAAYQT